MTMRVLVTGATGFLGRHLCRRLLGEGFDTTVLRRPDSRTEGLAGLRIRHAIGDVLHLGSIERAIEGQDYVVHAAAAMPGDPEQAQYGINVGGSRNVAEASLRAGVRRLLHVSSVAAVGIPDDAARPAGEDFVFNLGTSGLDYHISKHRAEIAVSSAIGRGLDGVIVNPCGIFGPAGSTYRGIGMFRSIVRGKIVRYATGGASVVHVEDVVDGIIRALQRGVSGSRYILAGDNLTFREMMLKTADALGAKPVLVPVPGFLMRTAAGLTRSFSILTRRPLSPNYANYYLASRCGFYDSNKARRELGFRPRKFDEILEESLDFLKIPEREAFPTRTRQTYEGVTHGNME